jgi:tetratricopeptide (TPR) repeat protein
MEAILRNYTTIPPHLYVHRAADYQLKKIIDEMDRPGYVLVARQMGKTNLLFNAKREIENEYNIFGYVDLSNSYSEERDCYRNIIDCILEPNEGIFSDLITQINAQRQVNILPPHKEHLKELRQLLNHFSGKIIIILDEIDALKNASYSDHIFAQIRSNYFARTNYPELNNLTYILSGVVEPSELIKDKNKSPFNIGEKIYLDDFTFEEFLVFLNLSKINIQELIAKHLYSWTNGNPRLTFDLCVEISIFLNKNDTISSTDIDTIIEKKYLTSFDVAPIDHIREVVKENAELRKALKKIYSNNIQEIDDELRQKLYLYGITSYSNSSSIIQIKNKILEKALSNTWLESLDSKSQSLFDIGLELITTNKNWLGGIKKLQEYLDSATKISEPNKNLSHYYLGYAYHSLEDYKTSNDYLIPEPIRFDSSPDLHYRQKLFIGLNYISLDEIDEGIKYLEEIVSKYKKGIPYANALLNLTGSLLDVDFEQNYKRGIQLLDDLIEISTSLKVDEQTENISSKEFRALAYYNKAEIFFKLGENENVLDSLNLAITISEPRFKPVLKLYLYNLDNKNQHASLLEIVDDIISNEVGFALRATHSLSFTEKKLFQILISLFEANAFLEYEQLIDYYENSILKNKLSKYEIVYQLSAASYATETVRKLLLPIIGSIDISNELALNISKRLSLVSHKLFDFAKHFDIYINNFISVTNSIESNDLTLFSFGIKNAYDSKKISESIRLIKIIEPKLKNLTDELSVESSIIYYWAAIIYNDLKNKQEALIYSEKALVVLESTSNINSSIIDKEGINSIRQRMLSMKSYLNRAPVVILKKYGRNDKITVRYSNGVIIEGKYKRFELDIEQRKCEVI